MVSAFIFRSLQDVSAFNILPMSSRMERLLICVRPSSVFDTRASPSPALASSASNVDGSTKSADTPASIDPSSPIGFVEDLLSTLSAASIDSEGSSKGQCLLDASSESWRRAIYQAIGAPPDVKNTQGVAKALQDAMARPNNQFAILMGSDGAEPFVATFPSDVVDYRDDGTAWLECRLRHSATDELLVTIGVQLISEQEQWKILTLDWQDFRPQFYSGLSGREWLRSF
jgi:hypothetical protein